MLLMCVVYIYACVWCTYMHVCGVHECMYLLYVYGFGCICLWVCICFVWEHVCDVSMFMCMSAHVCADACAN